MIALNTAWNLVNFRAGLIRALVRSGYDVVAVAPTDKYATKLQLLGCRFVHLPMDCSGTNPFRDLQLLARFFVLIRAERPDIYLGYTIKPNIYGSIAAHALGVPVINNVAGLGSAFAGRGWLNRLVRSMYKIALSRSRRVFFQNDEDREMFIECKLVAHQVADRVPGSGIDISKFTPRPLPSRRTVRFLLVARMLWEKGIREFVQAARALKRSGADAEFCLLGFVDTSSASAIPLAQIAAWTDEGVVRYLGVSDDVCEEMAQADCVVLPSFYREGTPRVLLEAAAMARPIVTTDSVGCRDVVDDGVNGFLCRPRDAEALAEKMLMIVRMSPAERKLLGLRGRAKIEREFDEEIVIRKYLNAIRSVLDRGRRS